MLSSHDTVFTLGRYRREFQQNWTFAGGDFHFHLFALMFKWCVKMQ